MRQTFFAAAVAALVLAVFLTFRYDESAKAQSINATPATMVASRASVNGNAECPYVHTASMQGGQCPYGAQCTNPAVCSHPGSAMSSASMVDMAPSVVPVVAKTSPAKSDNACPSCPACPAGSCSGHHTMAAK